MFIVGEKYSRARDIHDQYGGTRQSGISPSGSHPFIFLFTGDSGVTYGYEDGWQQDEAGNTSQHASSGSMTRSEALAVLGLGEDATRDDIVSSHRSLIQKIHPDRGGNDYLAAKINEAKDFLIKESVS